MESLMKQNAETLRPNAPIATGDVRHRELMPGLLNLAVSLKKDGFGENVVWVLKMICELQFSWKVEIFKRASIVGWLGDASEWFDN